MKLNELYLKSITERSRWQKHKLVSKNGTDGRHTCFVSPAGILLLQGEDEKVMGINKLVVADMELFTVLFTKYGNSRNYLVTHV